MSMEFPFRSQVCNLLLTICGQVLSQYWFVLNCEIGEFCVVVYCSLEIDTVNTGLPFFFSLSPFSSVCTHGVLLSMSQQVYVMI